MGSKEIMNSMLYIWSGLVLDFFDVVMVLPALVNKNMCQKITFNFPLLEEAA